MDGNGVANGGTETQRSASGPLRVKLPMSSIHRSTPTGEGYSSSELRALQKPYGPSSPGAFCPTTTESSLKFRLPVFRAPALPPRTQGDTKIRLKIPRSSNPHGTASSSDEEEEEEDCPDSSFKTGPLKVRLNLSEGGGRFSPSDSSATTSGSIMMKKKRGSLRKPTFECEYCGRTFAYNWSVKRHQKESCLEIPDEDRDMLI